MQPLKHSLSLIALMIVIFYCNQSFAQENLVIMQDYCKLQRPAIDLESHKTGHVEIHHICKEYDVIPWDEAYDIIYYHDISEKIRDYHFYRIDTIKYNQGFYNWGNDATVTIKLYNSETQQEFNVALFPTRDWNASTGVRFTD